eukprot:10599325-Alexandrium_andersonii.AAC.1
MERSPRCSPTAERRREVARRVTPAHRRTSASTLCGGGPDGGVEAQVASSCEALVASMVHARI